MITCAVLAQCCADRRSGWYPFGSSCKRCRAIGPDQRRRRSGPSLHGQRRLYFHHRFRLRCAGNRQPSEQARRARRRGLRIRPVLQFRAHRATPDYRHRALARRRGAPTRVRKQIRLQMGFPLHATQDRKAAADRAAQNWEARIAAIFRPAIFHAAKNDEGAAAWASWIPSRPS